MESYDLIIIGGGPAGITAGIYGARQKLNTLLITKSFGGQVARKVVMIENYPGFEEISGMELIQKFEKHLRKQKIDIERDEVSKVKKIKEHFIVITKSKNRFESKAVIVASGADPRPLEVPGEKKFIGRGLSYCVNCDGPLFEGKTVAVIGGGNSAFEAAIFLSKIAKKIYILEYGEVVKADAENQDRVKKTGKVKVITNAALKKIQGKQFVNSIIFEDRKTKKEITLPLEGVFVEIGSQPSTSFAKGLVDFNERDEIVVEFETCQTKTPGLFAAGDANIGPFKQIVTAAGEGTKAALAAYEYLQKLK
ncbi:MAG: thioredoxin-disulfide reductase [Candidatus Nealsonbacteria bacterium CG23_combo_of_CG06-09_8_20_14_all_38_19]|uniref:Thioredoxin-disulfide reductase n=1 Tax=Candidatus Nealsonbacteria bacterium CG23_combo_of_CG06-09_8_20_14_all_38_19 TaxID=1974721 RepID=A0A2G9YYV3_9BACT|nr:MAG: thioredoxin-disulfide reductase [Candidatus Nealsonbacteria bacterium CG23_combo_of_CG06-09_8_20_14_all_38_19]